MRSKNTNPMLFLTVSLLWIGGCVLSAQPRSYEVAPGGQLVLKADQGDVAVRLWDRNQVVVEAEGVEPDGLEISHLGNTVEVTYGGRRSWNDVQFEISVPRRFDLNLKTGAGDVSIEGNLEGQLQVSTAGGDIEFEAVSGDVTVKTHGGDIEAGDISGNGNISTLGGDIDLGSVGGTLDVNTMGGDISIRNVGSSALAKTMGGDIEIGDVSGKLEASTMGGDLIIGQVLKSATLKTAGGDIELRGASGDIVANTSGGDIELWNITGSVDAETSGGDIDAELSPRGSAPNRLVSKGGTLTLNLPAEARATVEARIRIRGSWRSRFDEYQIRSDFPSASHEEDEGGKEIRATYEINGGGPLITLETINGDIQIRQGRR